MDEQNKSTPREKVGDEDSSREQPEAGHPAPGVDVGSPEGGPGAGKERSTQPIGDEDQEKGQTQHPAPEDDVGTGDR